MIYTLEKMIDIERLKKLFDIHFRQTGISSALIALDGTIYASTDWQDICSQFHRKNSEACKCCISAYEKASSRMTSGESFVCYVCPFGLFGVAVPLIVKGEHIANMLIAQFLYEKPDDAVIEQFREQALKWGFEEDKYIEALNRVPVVPEGQMYLLKESVLLFVEMIGDMGALYIGEHLAKEAILKAYEELENEIKLRKTETDKLAQIIEANAIPTFVIDTGSRVTHWNKACEILTGVTASEILGTDRHQEIFYSLKRPLLADFLIGNASKDEFSRFYGDKIKKTSHNSDSFEGEDFFSEIGGKGKIIFYTAAVLKDPFGKICGAISTLQDVTEMKNAEQELRASEERYRHLFESANDAILLLKDGKVYDCNEKALFLFRCPRQQLIGTSSIDISPEIQPGGEMSIDEINRMIKNVYQNIPLIFEWRFVRKDGSFFDAGVSITKITISGTPYALSIIRDISETKRLINSLRMRETELDDRTRLLEKVNLVLKDSLDHRDIERKAVEESMLSNLKRFVFPYIQDMAQCRLGVDARAYLSLIETNLSEIVSPLSKSKFAKYIDLTPTEIRIAELIGNGRNTKEIAEILGGTPGSVQWHRKNIRKKFNLTNKKNNLQTFLKAIS